ncbi:hypothetical protein HU200_036761 [Digitaria exilis]|uniref:Uncharacterized protein n=1 Tax=Digitaria exilis TaxID=1010633 RepID=A0A835BEY2_9POAL|nr:hypothetical protein HU200_036761 [Digitaria exilis]
MRSGGPSSTWKGTFLDSITSAVKRTCSKESRRSNCLHAAFRKKPWRWQDA